MVVGENGAAGQHVGVTVQNQESELVITQHPKMEGQTVLDQTGFIQFFTANNYLLQYTIIFNFTDRFLLARVSQQDHETMNCSDGFCGNIFKHFVLNF